MDRLRARPVPAVALGQVTVGPAVMTLAEVLWDGQTVWVNGIDGLLGRFHPRRMDVHADNKCERCGPGTWEEFVAAMRELHGVDVPAEAAPQSGRGMQS